MNFLPLVISFLTIFGTFSLHFVSRQRLQISEKEAYAGSIRAFRKAHNCFECRKYDTFKVKNLPKPNPPSLKNDNEKRGNREKEKKVYFRIAWTGSSYGSINLYPLVTETGNHLEKIKEIAYRYLKQIYSQASFFKESKDPDLIKALLDFLIAEEKKIFKEKHICVPLNKLQPEEPLKAIYDRIIRGTNSFNPIEKKGYLPLEECVTFQAERTDVINFNFANPTLLATLFGEKVFMEIMMEEWPDEGPRPGHRPPSYALSEDELSELLGNRAESSLLELISWQYKKDFQAHKRSIDPKTNIAASD